MHKYTSVFDILDVDTAVKQAISLKKDPFKYNHLGKNKTLVMLFFNSSLRTRLSTEKAAQNLGLNVMVLNVSNAWKLEFEDGAVMNLDTAEHIKDAAQVVSQYADIIAVRAFPELKNKAIDASERILNSFVNYATVPVVNMESATAHPLQAFADAITIEELKLKKQPKVVLTWAPHPKALPHAVANSFVKMMQRLDVDFSIVHPKGYELDPKVTKDTPCSFNQEAALADADFVYAKNWSSYKNYGQVMVQDENWMCTKAKIANAKFMHCLPIRRNVVAEDALLDSQNSVVIQQANNRTFAAQYVLKSILEQQ